MSKTQFTKRPAAPPPARTQGSVKRPSKTPSAEPPSRPSRPITLPSGVFELLLSTGEIMNPLGRERDKKDRLLLLSDNSATLSTLNMHFEEEGYGASVLNTTEKSYEKCFGEFANEKPALVVIDVEKADKKEGALSLAHQIKEASPLTAIIIIFEDKNIQVPSIPCRVERLFFGTPDSDFLLSAVSVALEERSKRLEEGQEREKKIQDMERQIRMATVAIHDLKNHLTPLKAGVNMLEEDFDSLQNVKEGIASLEGALGSSLGKIVEDFKEDIDLIKSCVDSFVNTALKALRSRMRKGQEALFSPNEILQDILGCIRKDIEAKKIALEVSLDESLKFMHGDEGLFSSAIFNLLMNALQATSRAGKISVSSKKTDEDCISIIIQDTGVGIRKEALERIWEMGYTSHKDEGGTGVGMSIIKECAESMGANIVVRSKLLNGTTFTFTFPLKRNTS